MRKSARQGAAWEGAEWEVVDIVREVWMVRERCARRSLAAMVAVDLSKGLCWTFLDVVLQKCSREQFAVVGK